MRPLRRSVFAVLMCGLRFSVSPSHWPGADFRPGSPGVLRESELLGLGRRVTVLSPLRGLATRIDTGMPEGCPAAGPEEVHEAFDRG